MKYFYGILCVFGILLPYGVLIPWVIEHGLNIGLLITEASQTRIGLFAWLDVIVSALVVLGFIAIEGSRKGMKRLWIPALGTCTVGVSLGLPLFLLMREMHMEKQTL
jgi:hypothetical protein